MTELLIRTVASRPASRLARPSAVALFAIVIAFGSGLWLQVVHHLEGGVERGEPGFVAHWLRDSSLSLPLVFAAVWVAVLVARRLIQRTAAPPALAAAVLAATIAIATSAATAAGGPAHGYLFGAEHGGHELSPLLHLGRDALVALAVTLPLAGTLSALLLRRSPWAAPQVAGWLAAAASRRRASVAGLAVALIVLPMAIFTYSSAQLAEAQSAPGSPCPSRAPVKQFQVEAIDVDIPLNRFGDHDPQGKMYVLKDMVGAVRDQEQTRKVTAGLREDPIQPLVIRANLGDCVEIAFTNSASGGEFGMHIDGLAFAAPSSGDAVGNNASSAVRRGDTRTYRFFVPRDPELEGAHYIRPGPGNRDAVNHGLFGALSVQPAGSRYVSQNTGQPLASGWEAMIVPGGGQRAYREGVQIYHEIGDEDFRIPTAGGVNLPQVDPHTESYRPSSRAMNYRSEPFLHRLERAPQLKAEAYSSYPFGDPATPMMRSYQADPQKVRILHGGSEEFHVFHLHGGGIRWRQNPHADKSYDYQDTGLNKSPKTQASPSSRLDSQAFGPGESYDLEIEGGAGGVQQGAGEFLYHCHIAEHYISGMWSFWRVFDTRQEDLLPLPDRAALPRAVDSSQLIGKTMADGTTLTASNLDAWIRPQLPPPGVPKSASDATVWNWDRQGDVYLGEPEDTSSWPYRPEGVPGHPNGYPGDEFVGNRPKIRFNPVNGRPAFPLLRTNVGQRNPFSPNGHSGAPYLGENGNAASSGSGPSPWANRQDGICPSGAPIRRFNVVALALPIKVTSGASDPRGAIFVLAKDVDAVLAGTKPAEPLAIRGNIGDCIAVTLTSRLTDATDFGGFSKVNMHIHHVQFDTQASDGVISGMSFEQAVRPYQAAGVDETTLSQAASAGSSTITVANTSLFRTGTSIAVGQGTEDIEVRTIKAIDAGNSRLELDRALDKNHASGQWTGVEFVQYRWYPDVNLDNVFWHDHVDGIHAWGHGLVGQFIVEPKGSTYHDPKTGAEVDSGTYVDIHTNDPVAPGVPGSFRELALWQIDENPVTDSTLNLRAEPWADRLAANSDPSILFSSWTHGDPGTPVPKAYAGDPFVVRTINVGPSVDTLHVDGHRFVTEPRYTNGGGTPEGTRVDTLRYGISERYTAILEGGAGGAKKRSGDYLFMNGLGRRFRQGAWGILRVLDQKITGLQPLPGRDPGGAQIEPAKTGGRPPATPGPGSPCPGGAPLREFNVSAVDINGGGAGANSAFVPSSQAAAVSAGQAQAEPLVLHAAAGDCVKVVLKNERNPVPTDPAKPRVSLHVGKLDRTSGSSGVNIGFNTEQTISPGETREYRYHVDDDRLGSMTIADFGDPNSAKRGLYGALVVAPAGATFTDPVSGAEKTTGSQVDVHVPGSAGYRDFTLLLSDDDPVIGGNFMPYPTAVAGPALVNYRSAPRADNAATFSSRANGDPPTPVLRTYAGDPTQVHTIVAPGSEQIHSFSLGGQSFPADPHLPGSQQVQTRGVGPWEAMEAHIVGGAGGVARTTGDFFFGDLRRPFTQAGMWGLMRVISDGSCPIRPLDGLDCVGQNSLITDLPPTPAADPNPPAGDPATAPQTPSSPAPAGGGSDADLLRTLLAPRRMTIRTLARRGIPFRVTAPRSTRYLALKLVRLPQRIGGRRVRGALIARGSVRLRRGGFVSRRFKLTRRGVGLLRAGRYRLELQAGSSASRLDGTTLRRTIRFTGKPIKSKRKRR